MKRQRSPKTKSLTKRAGTTSENGEQAPRGPCLCFPSPQARPEASTVQPHPLKGPVDLKHGAQLQPQAKEEEEQRGGPYVPRTGGRVEMEFSLLP